MHSTLIANQNAKQSSRYRKSTLFSTNGFYMYITLNTLSIWYNTYAFFVTQLTVYDRRIPDSYRMTTITLDHFTLYTLSHLSTLLQQIPRQSVGYALFFLFCFFLVLLSVEAHIIIALINVRCPVYLEYIPWEWMCRKKRYLKYLNRTRDLESRPMDLFLSTFRRNKRNKKRSLILTSSRTQT